MSAPLADHLDTVVASLVARFAPRLPQARWIERSQRATGLDDFGDALFGGELKGALFAWAEAAERDARLSLFGRFVVHQDFTQMLRVRLGVVEALRRTPAILEEKIVRPIFIIGLPRSGTTMLHRLSALPPDMRAPLLWELRHPNPPHGRDTRLRNTKLHLAIWDKLVPQFRIIHPLSADAAEECVVALSQTFQTTHLDVRTRAPSFVRWVLSQDARPVYRYHRALLQLLQHGQPARRWVLKAPEHLFALDALLDVYPDACFVHLHRDPVRAAPSGCSLVAGSRSALSAEVDRKQIGAEWIEHWATALELALGVRDAIGPARFCDVHYDALIADPAGTLRRIHERFDACVGPDHEPNVARWLAANASDRHGRHVYTLEEFGLVAEQVRERFAFYWDRYGRT